jgi:hypothetical protein
VWSAVLKVFRRHAGWFVAISWLLFAVTIPICLAIGVTAGIDAFYFPTHRMAPFDRFDIKASEFALLASAVAATAASISIALKFRAAASLLVVGIWSVILFGTQAARLLVQPGPEYFERHLGQQLFLVPWQYAPGGHGSTDNDGIGISVQLCISNLKGAFDDDCHGRQQQLYIVPREWVFRLPETDFRRTRRSQMSAGSGRNGYQSYIYKDTQIDHYFVREDPQGQLTRFVVCRRNNEDFCSHHARMGNYGLRYDAPLTQGDTLDGKLENLIESWRVETSAAPKASACRYLAGLIDKAPPGPLFLPSYPTVESGPLHGAAYLYDNAVAAIALAGCGERDKASRIGAAILRALGNDRTWHDGRLRNAYAAGVVANGAVKLPGWWDNTQNKWLEDRYQAGSDVGNMAWAMLALLSIDNVSGDDVSARSRFRDGAARLGAWVAQWADTRGTGGFTGGTFGHEPTPDVRTWKSTEHNTDLAAAFGLLAIRTGDSRWRDMATAAEHFVDTMWDPACTCFAAGTAEDGVTRNPILALDAQVWPLMALPGAARKFASAIATTEQRMSVNEGFSYGEDRDGVWTEGTGQMALLMELLGRTGKAKSLIVVIESQRSPDGGFYATSVQALPTGFMLDTDPIKPRFYFRLPHLGAAAWAALAEREFNPFTAAKRLP